MMATYSYKNIWDFERNLKKMDNNSDNSEI